MVDVNSIYHSYKGKKVFITGHTGFKGSWLTYVLSKAGAIIKGYALAPNTTPALYSLIENDLKIESIFADINNALLLEKELLEFQPDFVFHLAAQPLVRKSYKDPLDTFTTNIIGTANVLNALTNLDKTCTCIFITTDKVYENREWFYPYRETDNLGGYDPYSASKAGAELIINSYRSSFFNLLEYHKHKKAIVSVRAGNVIGGGDWSEDRLVPDIVRSIANGEGIAIRNPQAVRPWQHVLEPVFGYLKLAFLLANDATKYSGAWNFGPSNDDNLPVLSIVKKAIEIWGTGTVNFENNGDALHEANLLKLDISKASKELHWRPQMNAGKAIERTINWYKFFYLDKQDAGKLIESDILFYQSLLNR